MLKYGLPTDKEGIQLRLGAERGFFRDEGVEVAYASAEGFEKQVREEDLVFRALVKDFGLMPAPAK